MNAIEVTASTRRRSGARPSRSSRNSNAAAGQRASNYWARRSAGCSRQAGRRPVEASVLSTTLTAALIGVYYGLGDIARSVENVLQWTTYLTKDAIKVKVEKGWVTLTGEVEWQYQRQAAAEAIRYLMGVSGVSNQITIKTKVSAPVVKSDIEAALKRRAQQDAHEISVSVHGTDVTLTGTVHSWSERELARNTAWGTPGVRSVVDNTTMSY